MCPKLTTSFHQHPSSVLISYTTFLRSKPEVCKSDSPLLFCYQGVIPKGRGINYNRFILFLNTMDSDKYNHLLFFPHAYRHGWAETMGALRMDPGASAQPSSSRMPSLPSKVLLCLDVVSITAYGWGPSFRQVPSKGFTVSTPPLCQALCHAVHILTPLLFTTAQ